MSITLNDIAKACKLSRLKYGATQVDVAKETGYTQQTISSFEAGRTNNAILFGYYISRFGAWVR